MGVQTQAVNEHLAGASHNPATGKRAVSAKITRQEEKKFNRVNALLSWNYGFRGKESAKNFQKTEKTS